VAAKYLNDSSPKNKHWAAYARIFDITEVNLMEKQLLFLLDYDFRFDEAEACEAFKPFFSTPSSQAVSVSTRQKAVSKVAEASKTRVQAQLPPTPPYDSERRTFASAPTAPVLSTPATAAQSIATTVNSIARRLSKTYLGASSTSVPASATAVVTPIKGLITRIASSSSAASGEDSETSMGSLTEDNGSTESSDELLSDDDLSDDEVPVRIHGASFVLQPIQPIVRGRGAHSRKVSDTATIAAHASCTSLHTARSDVTLSSVALADADRSPKVKQYSSPVIASFVHKRSLRLRRPKYYAAGPMLTPSQTMPSLASPVRAAPAVSAASGFLSRMWGVATKGAGATAGDGSEPAAPRGLRRLASRPHMFRSGLDGVTAELEA
jgi:G1/S-specific cyclin PLC1